MMASAAISAETAQFLFSNQWEQLENVTDNDSFQGMRLAFNQQVRSIIGEDENTHGLSLLQFEFYARAGVDGLNQFERFQTWSQALVIDNADAQISPTLKDEYRKALWLEMRICEARTGLTGFSNDIKRFSVNAEAIHDNGIINCEIDLARNRLIDRDIKAEIGHWQYEPIADHLRCFWDRHWLAELVDRQNVSGYSPLLEHSFSSALPIEQWTPEARLFAEGRYSISGHKDEFPLYPAGDEERKQPGDYRPYRYSLGGTYRPSLVVHYMAEQAELRIRGRIMRAWQEGLIETKDILKIYKDFGFHLYSLFTFQSSDDEIFYEIEKADLTRLDPIKNLENRMTSSDSFGIRRPAALTLLRIKKPAVGTAEYNRLLSFTVPAKEAVKFGPGAKEALEKALASKSFSEAIGVLEAIKESGVDEFVDLIEKALMNHFPPVRSMAAELLIAFRKLSPNTPEYNQLYAHILFSAIRNSNDEDALIALGEDALPALRIAATGIEIGESLSQRLMKRIVGE
jgi:hypothetical protein